LSQVEPRMGAAGIDPRIRARRIEVQRVAGRRRLRRLVDVGLVLAVALGFYGALRSSLLDVGEVTVSGAGRTGAAAVVEAAGIEAGDQLIDVELGASGARVAALPWVDEVRLHRRLGGRVEIVVAERTPAAVLGEGAEAVVVDAKGRVLARASEVPDSGRLVRVVGISGALVPGAQLGADAADALGLAGRLAAVVPGSISVVTVGEDLTATLAQGGEVRFGDTSRLTAKLRSLETVLQQVDLVCLDQLDLRAPGNPVLTRRAGCS
jgi:cell division septal protein FtsQ